MMSGVLHPGKILGIETSIQKRAIQDAYGYHLLARLKKEQEKWKLVHWNT
jgi:hypothetical protein